MSEEIPRHIQRAMDSIGTVGNIPRIQKWLQIAHGCREWASIMRTYMVVCATMRPISNTLELNTINFARIMQRADRAGTGILRLALKYEEKAAESANAYLSTASIFQDWGMHCLFGQSIGPNGQGSRARCVYRPHLQRQIALLRQTVVLSNRPMSQNSDARPSSIECATRLNRAAIELGYVLEDLRIQIRALCFSNVTPTVSLH
ncbi:hypothetical protein CMQ_5270 [Grosmannia clavigera kw1407]|uniref:Uncharacterized protein n=1 Tax=Grosmannia clavigera (strain kw1407 / UAMH 11150) TaxID=655863 RepID=F0XBJ8_GROCL|nr:uncharacterized protein CMQ_5270 [Grosmannia clavigera kw1407]EFX05008.1 hypothetical protein CMQ_5270 [Grosmannia clavigera kw1407]